MTPSNINRLNFPNLTLLSLASEPPADENANKLSFSRSASFFFPRLRSSFLPASQVLLATQLEWVHSFEEPCFPRHQ